MVALVEEQLPPHGILIRLHSLLGCMHAGLSESNDGLLIIIGHILIDCGKLLNAASRVVRPLLSCQVNDFSHWGCLP